jgi:2-phosphosulfolactate phosphatase
LRRRRADGYAAGDVVALVRSPAALVGDPRRVGTAVVVDVLRATSTATVLLARDLVPFDVVARPADLAALPGGGRPLMVITELKEGRAAHAWIDNSPVLVGGAELAGHQLVLVTTNGTRALASAAARAERVLIASFLNLSAAAGWIRDAQRDEDEVWIVPAGNVERDEQRTEDSECAEALKAMLEGADPRLDERLARVRGDARVQRRLTKEGPSFAADLDLCLELDRYPVVPRFVADAPSRGHVVRA